MADDTSDLLKQAQFIQGQKLLEQAQTIQKNVTAPEPMSAGEAALIKGEEGSQLGLRPVIAGVGSAIGQLAGRSWNQNDTLVPEVVGAFKEGRQGAIDEQNQAQTEHPAISTAANIGGSLLTTPFIGAPKTILSAAKLGTGLGLAQAAGTAQSLPEAVEMTGTGTLGGVLGYGAAKGIGAIASPGLQSLAETKAFKASGAMLKDFRAAFARDPEKINELGRTMLDNGLVRPGDSVKSIAQKAEVLRQETGQKIGKVYDSVDKQLTSHESQLPPETIMQIRASGFHPEEQADGIKAMLAQKYKGIPGSSTALQKASTVIDELAANGNNITPQHAIELKGHVDAMINWSKKSMDLPIEQDLLKDIRGFIQGRLNDQVSMMDQALGTSQSKELVKLNRLYGNASQIAEVAKDRVLREGVNQSFGLGDKVAAGIGAAVGGAPGAIAGGGINHVLSSYGNAIAATEADALSRKISNPATYMPVMSTTIRRRDDLKKLAAPGNGGEIELGSHRK